MTAPVELTDAGWDAQVAESPAPVLVDFWAPWCVPCTRIAPLVEEVAQRYAGRLTVGKLNIDEHPRSAVRYDVLSIPTLILFVGGRQVARLVGVVRAGDIEDAVSPHIV